MATKKKRERGEWLAKLYERPIGDFYEFLFEVDDEEGLQKCIRVLIPKFCVINTRVNNATQKRELLISSRCRKLEKLKALLSEEEQRLGRMVASV
jgi:hypothetical protein